MNKKINDIIYQFNQDGEHESQVRMFKEIIEEQNEFDEEEYVYSLYYLGVAYMLGRGIEQDLDKARDYLENCNLYVTTKKFDFYNSLEEIREFYEKYNDFCTHKAGNTLNICEQMMIENIPTIIAKEMLYPNEKSIEDELFLIEFKNRDKKEEKYLNSKNDKIKILIIHELGGSMYSSLVTYLKEKLPFQVYSFDIPIRPYYAMQKIYDKVNRIKPDIVVASSFGAFYAEFVDAKYKIYINPVLDAAKNINKLIRKRKYEYCVPHLDYKYYKLDERMNIGFSIVNSLNSKASNIDRNNVYGIFATNDEQFNDYNNFISKYSKKNVIKITDGHLINVSINGHIITNLILQIIKKDRR